MNLESSSQAHEKRIQNLIFFKSFIFYTSFYEQNESFVFMFIMCQVSKCLYRVFFYQD